MARRINAVTMRSIAPPAINAVPSPLTLLITGIPSEAAASDP